jgi:hypothetical protein
MPNDVSVIHRKKKIQAREKKRLVELWKLKNNPRWKKVHLMDPLSEC